MKILMVSMNSIHFVRWTEQLKNSGHEVFWFDVLGGGEISKLPWVTQIVNWKQKYPNLKGRHFIKKKLPWLYKKLSFLIERNTAKQFEKVLQEVKPDVVHSIVLYISCTPILKIMQKYKTLPWIYSSWGSDLFYYRNVPKYKQDILKVLPYIDYLITDCKRDIKIAKTLGFEGEILGTFPGGGGFDFEISNKYLTIPISNRKIILVKGYQGRSGRCIEVLKALMRTASKLKSFEIVVFGADKEVIHFVNKNKLSQYLKISIYSRDKFLPHIEVLKLMGKALIYIGNSNSDGMPNTLLEAIIMGAFPIQSNPGGASAEVIEHNQNGMLINECEDVDEIQSLIFNTVSNYNLINNAFSINQNQVKANYEREKVKKKVLSSYHLVNKKIV